MDIEKSKIIKIGAGECHYLESKQVERTITVCSECDVELHRCLSCGRDFNELNSDMICAWGMSHFCSLECLKNYWKTKWGLNE